MSNYASYTPLRACCKDKTILEISSRARPSLVLLLLASKLFVPFSTWSQEVLGYSISCDLIHWRTNSFCGSPRLAICEFKLLVLGPAGEILFAYLPPCPLQCERCHTLALLLWWTVKSCPVPLVSFGWNRPGATKRPITGPKKSQGL